MRAYPTAVRFWVKVHPNSIFSRQINMQFTTCPQLTCLGCPGSCPVSLHSCDPTAKHTRFLPVPWIFWPPSLWTDSFHCLEPPCHRIYLINSCSSVKTQLKWIFLFPWPSLLQSPSWDCRIISFTSMYPKHLYYMCLYYSTIIMHYYLCTCTYVTLL